MSGDRKTWMRIGAAASLATLVTVGSWAGEPTTPRVPRGKYKVEVVEAEGCPIQILNKKTRVASTLDYDPWGTFKGKADRQYGSGEFQLIYDVAFKNRSDLDVLAVAFLWEALDAGQNVIYERIDIHGRQPLSPGRIEKQHRVELDHGHDPAAYRVSVMQVKLSDGTVWNPPALVDEGAPGP